MYDEEIIETNGMTINDAIDYISELFAGNREDLFEYENADK